MEMSIEELIDHKIGKIKVSYTLDEVREILRKTIVLQFAGFIGGDNEETEGWSVPARPEQRHGEGDRPHHERSDNHGT